MPISTPAASVTRSSVGMERRWKVSIRSRANSSASRSLSVTARSAASISAPATRSLSAVSSRRSSRAVCSISAASPRARTSRTIARAAASTSSATSRFIARRLAKRASKSGSEWLSCTATDAAPPINGAPYTSRAGFRLAGERVVGPGPGRPSRAKIGQPGLDDLDIDLDGATAGEDQRDLASRRIRDGEVHGEKLQHRLRPGAVDRTGAHRADAVKRHRSAAALVVAAAAVFGLFPSETVHAEGEAALLRQIEHVADLEDGVLYIGRENCEVFLVDGGEPERVGFGHGGVFPCCRQR